MDIAISYAHVCNGCEYMLHITVIHIAVYMYIDGNIYCNEYTL